MTYIPVAVLPEVGPDELPPRHQKDGEPRSHSVIRQALRLNRNLALYPLARDLRRKPKWRRSEPTGRFWIADLPGKLPGAKQIEMRLLADVPGAMRRAPTGTDMAVLFAVMAEVQAAGGVVISNQRASVVRSVEWPSMTSLIKSIGLDPAIGNRVGSQVRSALDYWQNMELIYRNIWREQGRVAERHYLPPPFESVTRRGRGVAVEVAREWRGVASAKGYWVEIPLPLPATAAAQNLVLMMLTQSKAKMDFDTRWLARKVGLDSSRRNATLESAISAAQEWFVENGGELVVVQNVSPDDVVPPNRTWASVARVRIPRRRSTTRSERKPPGKQTRSERKPKTRKTRSERKPINEPRVTTVTQHQNEP